MSKVIQSSFSRGEIGPALYGRVDIGFYQNSLRRASNMFVHQFGGISNRPGFQFIGPVKDLFVTMLISLKLQRLFLAQQMPILLSSQQHLMGTITEMKSTLVVL